MQITDRFLTITTGVVLAIAGGAASLWLGGEEKPGEPLVIAALTAPEVAMPSAGAEPSLTVSDLGVTTLLPGPKAPRLDLAPVRQDVKDAQPLILAAVEPTMTGDARTDLAEANVSVADVAPVIAKLSDIKGIVLTRSVTGIDAPSAPRVAAVEPSVGSGLQQVSLPATPAADCVLDVRVMRLTGARVRLSLAAPCHPQVDVVIEHAGLRFKERLDAQGKLALKVPVFAEFSRFNIILSDGTRTSVGAYISGLSSVDRVGISWSGANDTFLHARTAGSEWGGPGHIWRMAPRSYAEARMSGGGYLVTLGDPTLKKPMLTQVFTLPHRPNRGALVSIEVETLREDCGGRLDLALATHAPLRGAMTKRLVTRPAACGSGDSLVLKNLVKDLNVAAR